MKVNPSAAALSDSPSVLRRQVTQAGEVTRKMAPPIEIGPASAQEVQASAVYTPSDDATDVTYSHLKLSVQSGHSYGSSEKFTETSSEMHSAFRGMKSAWNAFRQTLATSAPDLIKKDFSFSVDKNGDMMAVNSHGDLTATQVVQLSELMNKSAALKSATKNFADRTIDYANNGGSPLTRVDLNMANFHKSLDIGTLLEHSQPSRIDWNVNLIEQIFTKGAQRTWDIRD
jgi:hypothetical protein